MDHGIVRLPPFQPRTTLLNVVIETSLGSTVKLKYDEETGVFRAHKAMPLGFCFPFNFGFVPGTVGGDGDPLDVLLLSSHSLVIGTVVSAQIVAILEAEQIEAKVRKRNDRVIAVPWNTVSNTAMIPTIALDVRLKRAITDFFREYNEVQGKRFAPLRFSTGQRARQIIRQSMNAGKKTTTPTRARPRKV
jgi:inorganic pyrophosphatase